MISRVAAACGIGDTGDRQLATWIQLAGHTHCWGTGSQPAYFLSRRNMLDRRHDAVGLNGPPIIMAPRASIYKVSTGLQL
jgi:hypothetical protein